MTSFVWPSSLVMASASFMYDERGEHRLGLLLLAPAVDHFGLAQGRDDVDVTGPLRPNRQQRRTPW
jgi:hypothetical protein